MNAEEWLGSLNGRNDDEAAANWVPSGGRLRSGRVTADSAIGGFESLRAAVMTAERQLVVDAAGRTVVLDLSPIDDDSALVDWLAWPDRADTTDWRVVRGCVDDDEILVVQVCSLDGVESALAVSDAYGEFEFAIPVGRWLLVLSGDDIDVDVELDVA